MKKLIVGLIAGVLVAVGLPLGSADAAPYCGITWGSLGKSSLPASSSELTNVRTGRHACYDRMVFDLSGPATGYDVRYVSNISSEGEGAPISLKGGAKLQIVVRAPSYGGYHTPSYPAKVGEPLPGVSLTGYQTFRDAKFAGSFEGQSTIGLGVRAKLPFRVLKDGHKVIVDVAHNW